VEVDESSNFYGLVVLIDEFGYDMFIWFSGKKFTCSSFL